MEIGREEIKGKEDLMRKILRHRVTEWCDHTLFSTEERERIQQEALDSTRDAVLEATIDLRMRMARIDRELYAERRAINTKKLGRELAHYK